MKLVSVPFLPGVNNTVEPAFMTPGQLTVAQNLRPVRGGRLSKRPKATLKYAGSGFGQTLRAIGHVGGANLLAVRSQLLVESKVSGDLESVGDLAAGTPIGMWDCQHTGDDVAESSEVQVRRSTAAVSGGLLVVAYEYVHGIGSASTRIRVRVIERATRRVRTETAIDATMPMIIDVPGHGLRLFYVSNSAAGVRCRDIDLTISGPVGAEYASAIASSGTVAAYSVAGHSSIGEYYIVTVSSGTVTVWRVDDDNVSLGSAVAATSITTRPSVDLCVSVNRVWVAWCQMDDAGARVYSHDLTTFDSTAITLDDTGQSSIGTPFIGYRLGDDSAYILWACNDSTRGQDSLNAFRVTSAGALTVLTRSIQGLRPLSRPTGVSGVLGSRVFFAASQPTTEAPNPHRVYQLREDDGGTWKAISEIVLDGEAQPPEDADMAGQLGLIDHTGGVFTWVQRVRLRGSSTAAQFALREWEMRIDERHARQFIDVDGTALIPGGELLAFDGTRTYEAGIVATPVLRNLTPGGAGSMGAGSYTYQLVYEALDAKGRLRRSPPSLPRSITIGASERVNLALLAPATNRTRVPFATHVYRSSANGSVLRRLTAIRAGLTGPTGVDNAPDSSALEARPVLYTEGGVLPYDPAPASTFGVRALGRVWLGGLFERNRIVCSVDIVPGEMPGFPQDATHRLDFPDEVTGLANLGDDLVVFTRSGIWVVSGDGPTITGAGGFATPQRVPADFGCIDWRSVVSTTIGVFFQGPSEIMLLPLGGGPPEYVGSAISSESGAYVVAAGLHGEGDSAVVRFARGSSPTAERGISTVVFHLRTRTWWSDSYNPNIPPKVFGNWRAADGTAMAVVGGWDLDEGLRIEEKGADSEYPATLMVTGEIAPFGFGVEFRIHRVWLRMAQRGGQCTVRISAVFDDRVPFSPANDFIEKGILAPTLDEPIPTPLRLEWSPRQHQCKNVRFVIQDTQNGPATSQGVDYLGLVLEVDHVGPQQLASANRR